MSERTAEGTIALLGSPERVSSANPRSQVIDGYVTFTSLDTRPVRTLRAEVRPPNGCYDVLVDLRPRAIGVLKDGDVRYAVVGREGDAFDWVVTQIRAVSRSRRGPYAGATAC
jgi:hypothetical protein